MEYLSVILFVVLLLAFCIYMSGFSIEGYKAYRQYLKAVQKNEEQNAESLELYDRNLALAEKGNQLAAAGNELAEQGNRLLSESNELKRELVALLRERKS